MEEGTHSSDSLHAGGADRGQQDDGGGGGGLGGQNLFEEEMVFDQDPTDNGKAKKKSPKVQTLSVDFDALLPHIGEMGRYQVDTRLCLISPNCFNK